MRLAFLLEQCFAAAPGGTGRYSRELAAALARTAAAGDVVTGWAAWHRETAPARVVGVAGPRRLPVPAPALVRAWRRGLPPVPPADLVHAPTLLMPPRRRRPVVVTIHDAVPWTHPETLTAHGVRWHRAMAERAARYADLVVADTHAVAADLTRALPRLRADRLLVVGAGSTPQLGSPPPDADERAAALRLPEQGFFLSIGTFEPRKGLDVAVSALAEPAAPGLPLLLVGGPGWGGVDPVADATRLGVGERVRVLGPVTDADLAVLLSRATALLAPSRSEGFGLPLLEAMSAGLPAIISAAPALVEVGGGAPRVVPVGDAAALAAAMAELAGDPALRARLSAAGRARAAHYTWDGAAGTLWSAYRTLT